MNYLFSAFILKVEWLSMLKVETYHKVLELSGSSHPRLATWIR